MFNKIGTGELILILAIALFVIGPEKLPGVAKSIGKVLGSARKYLKDITEEIKEEVKTVEDDLDEVKKDFKETQKELEAQLRETPEENTAAKSDEGTEQMIS